MKDVVTRQNICLFNFRCDQVNKHIANNVVKRDGFFEGMDIVCKKHLKTTKLRLYVNYPYVIKTIDDKCVVLIEPVENTKMTITYKILNDHFKLPYAN